MTAAGMWQVIWVVAVVAFSAAEILTPTAFFFLPFAAGAAVALIASALGAGPILQTGGFITASAAGCWGLWPVGRRMAKQGPAHAIGSNRWLGRQAVAVTDVPALGSGTSGTVQLGSETWRAESGFDCAIPAGSAVVVTAVHGTRLIVLPVSIPTDKGAM